MADMHAQQAALQLHVLPACSAAARGRSCDPLQGTSMMQARAHNQCPRSHTTEHQPAAPVPGQHTQLPQASGLSLLPHIRHQHTSTLERYQAPAFSP
jgi:hypothetical protein